MILRKAFIMFQMVVLDQHTLSWFYPIFIFTYPLLLNIFWSICLQNIFEKSDFQKAL